MPLNLERSGPRGASTDRIDRRTFLEVAAALTAALGIPSILIGSGPALAALPLAADAGPRLLRIAKDIYPHDGFLPDEPYQAVVDAILEEARTNAAVAVLCAEGLEGLDARTHALYGRLYADVGAEHERVAALRAIETTAFFQKLRGGLLFGLYDNKKLWPVFGYEGSSWEQGGYLGRGFDDLAWL